LSAGLEQAPRPSKCPEPIDRPAYVLRELPIVELDQIGPEAEGAVESRAGEIDDHRNSCGPDVGDDRLVHLAGQAICREGVADDEHRTSERSGTRRGDEIVHLVALRSRPESGGDHVALSAAAVDDVAPA
jgi:hypothetical protein